MLTAQIVKRKIVKYDNLSISEPGDLDAAVLLNVYMGTENKLNDQRNNNMKTYVAIIKTANIRRQNKTLAMLNYYSYFITYSMKK